ncbi:FHA domain-containing protein, partial [uncultured Microbacterium sp.]
RRTHGDVADPVYARGFDGTPASFGVADEAAETDAGERPAATGLAGWAPTRAPEQPAADAASTPAVESAEARSPFADWWPEVLDEDPDTDSAVDDPVPGVDEKPVGDDEAPAAPPPPVTAAPVIAPPPRPADLPAVDSAAEQAVEDREEVPPPLRRSTARPAWNGFDLSVPGEFTGEVTDAVPGAPAPISAVPSAPVADESHPPAPPEPVAPREFVEPSVPPEPAEPAASPEPAEPAEPAEPTSSPAVPPAPPAAPTPPPVTRAPAVARDAAAPSSSEDDAFPDDGGVSAIVGAPVAGSPLSARSSVSARFADVSRDEELADHTIVTRRRRTGWVLVGPDGERIPLSEEVAIVGRRPSVDAAFPQAQLITVGDPTRTVSKTHARLELRGDVWAVVDLDSTNGVVLIADNDDETDVEPGAVTRLTPRFLLGDAELRLEEAAAS